MAWIVEWSMAGMSDVNVSLWNSKHEALAAACAAVMDIIINEWDLTESDWSKRAELISDECSASNWEVAVDLFNDWESGSDCAQHFRIYEKQMQTKVPTIRLIKPMGKPTVPAPAPIPTATSFQANTPGATCRGPCQSYNEHAYADKSDGTYCCYQCKFMSQVFGKDIT